MLFPYKRFIDIVRSHRTEPSTASMLDEPPPVSIIDTFGRPIALTRRRADTYELTRVPIDLQELLNRRIASSLSHPANRGLRCRSGITPPGRVFYHQVGKCQSIVYIVRLQEGQTITAGSSLDVRYTVRDDDADYDNRSPKTGVAIVVSHVLPQPRHR